MTTACCGRSWRQRSSAFRFWSGGSMRVGVEFGQPLWLFGLPIVLVLLVLGRYPSWWAVRRLGRVALRRELGKVAVRFVWTAILLLALADTRLIRYLPRQAVVLVEDVSASL